MIGVRVPSVLFSKLSTSRVLLNQSVWRMKTNARAPMTKFGTDDRLANAIDTGAQVNIGKQYDL